MIDSFIENALEIYPEAENHPASPKQKKNIPHHDEPFLDEQAIAALELAHSVYAFHGTPQPLEMIRLLSSLDSQFLSGDKQIHPEKHVVEELLGMFL
jgi:hypothetical protein